MKYNYNLSMTSMGDSDAQIFAEDLVFYAMQKRNQDWKRVLWNIDDNDPAIKRVFTPEIGKAVLNFGEQECWYYMDCAEFLIQELVPDKRYSYGKLIYCLAAVGNEFLDYERKDTFFSFCALIVEISCYCLKKDHKTLIESAIVGAGIAINVKLGLSTEKDPDRYHRFAVEYNKVYDELFKPGEKKLALSFIAKYNNNSISMPNKS